MAKSKVDEFFEHNQLEFEKMPSPEVWSKIEENLDLADGIVSTKKIESVTNTTSSISENDIKTEVVNTIDNTKQIINNPNFSNDHKIVKPNFQFLSGKNLQYLALAASLFMVLVPVLYLLKSDKSPLAKTQKDNFYTANKRNTAKKVTAKNIDAARLKYKSKMDDSKKSYEVVESPTYNKAKAIVNKENAKIKNKINLNRNYSTPNKIITPVNTWKHEIVNYQKVDIKPIFPGGEREMLDYIYANLEYPNAAKKEAIQGLVILDFVVNEDGSISKIEVSRDIGFGCGEEAAALIANMPKWKPGFQNGYKVKVAYKLPINFDLEIQDKAIALNGKSKKNKKQKRTKKVVEQLKAAKPEVLKAENSLDELIESESELNDPIVIEKIVQIDHSGKMEYQVNKSTRSQSTSEITEAIIPVTATKTTAKSNYEVETKVFSESEKLYAIQKITGKWKGTLIGKSQFTNIQFLNNENNTYLRLYNKTGYELMEYELKDVNSNGFVFVNKNPFHQNNILISEINSNKIELQFSPPLPSEKNNSFKFKREY